MTMRRGACPSLSAPMTTGDGLLVRLNPRGGMLTPVQLAGIARAAARHGNGLLEITARGSLQIRGLTAGSVAEFTAAIAALDIGADEGVEIRTGPLAGCDPDEIADPRPLAESVRSGLAQRGLLGKLAPKVSVVIDGGGALGLCALSADVRLEAVAGDDAQWRVAVGGNGAGAMVLGQGDATAAVEAALGCLAVLTGAGSAARARDLPAPSFSKAAAGLDAVRQIEANGRPPRLPGSGTIPVGEFALSDGVIARGFALPFGQTGAKELAAFADGLDAEWAIRLAPGRGLLVMGLSPAQADRVVTSAEDRGLVPDPEDPRLRIAACAGAPACASAHLPTKQVAAAVVAGHLELLAGGAVLHISGCAKKCARPAGPSVALVGSERGFDVEGDGKTVAPPTRRALTQLAQRFVPGQRKSA